MHLIKNTKEKERIIEIFEKAYYSSPGVTWMIGDNKKKLNPLLNLLVLEAQIKQGAFITEDNNGALLFFQIQNKSNSLKLSIKKIYTAFFVLGLKQSIKALKYKRIIEEIRPKNGFMGVLVATDENKRDSKTGFEIKNEMSNIANKSNETIYVETTKPRVKKLYEIAGYTDYKSIKHPYEDLTIWFMEKQPE